MEKNKLIQLTNTLYRLTLFFPKKEPLRYKMREIAIEILAGLINKDPLLEVQVNPSGQELKTTETKIWLERVINNLELLDCFFEVTKNQNWVGPGELLEIQEEYNKIKTEIQRQVLLKSIENSQQTPTITKEQVLTKFTGLKPQQSLNLRQEKILEILKEKERVQVWQIKEIFSEVSKRTLRRDFQYLLKQGIIERIGERNETFYQLKR